MNQKNNTNKTLFLIPVPLAQKQYDSLSYLGNNLLKTIDVFIAESPKTARRIISGLGVKVQEKTFIDIENMTWESVPPQAEQIGLISEAGCPCVADPGNSWVRLAHQNNVKVVPVSGPSSIIMALMASGLNGQNFAFNGYLPVNKELAVKTILKLEKKIYAENQTQIFIETPYRNESILKTLISCLKPETILCAAWGLSTNSQQIISQPINIWRKNEAFTNKEPCTFVLGKY